MDAYVCGGARSFPSPEGASNLQPVLHHAGVLLRIDFGRQVNASVEVELGKASLGGELA